VGRNHKGHKLTQVRSGYYLRQFAKKDVLDILEIETFTAQKFWNGDDFYRSQRQEGSFGYVITNIDSVVGFIVGQVRGDDVEIQNFAVHPEHERQGLGTVLIDHIKDIIPEDGLLSLKLRATNRHLHRFLEERGFSMIKVYKNHFINWVDELKQPECEDAHLFTFAG
jgi:ribosomal-protein-alanine N-acetyltransferase